MSDIPAIGFDEGPQPKRTVDDILGAAPKLTPDELLGAPPLSANQMALGGADMDEYFSQGSMGSILNTFGQGAKNGWGDQPLGVSKDTEDFMRKAGIWNQYEQSSRSFVKTLNEAIMRPAAVALDTAFRAPMAIYHGLGDLTVEAGVPRDIVGMVEAFPAGHQTGFPALPPTPQALVLHAERLAQARSLGVVGEGEAGWKGTVEPAPDAQTARADAIKETIAAAPKDTTEGLPGAAPAPEPAGPDLHVIARQIAPDTFAEFDTLSARKDTFHQWLDDLSEQRDRGTSPAIAALDEEIDRLRGENLTLPRGKRVESANRITALEEQRKALVDAMPNTGDTPEMARVRRDLIATDERMRDMAPDVSDAYRKAAGGVEPASEPVAPPVAETAPEPAPAAQPVEEPAPAPTPPPEAISPAPAAPETPPAPQPQLEGGIAGDVSRKLVAAGRPEEEAGAIGAIQEMRYRTRAANLKGSTPEQLYAEEAPAITANKNITPNGPGFDVQTKEGLFYADTLEAAQRLSNQHGALDVAEGNKLGAITIGNGRTMIHLLSNSDASTAIHELGHSYLEELIRDSADERATDAVRADAGTIRKWLGVEEGADIPRRAHEKFARGFERYMMEGHAPTQALAEVFAKFKKWLTDIYQTVGRLRSPISDDVRRVFDRMLANEGDPVITPEREPARSFADRHEVDAQNTEPEHAAQVAENVRGERDRIAPTVAPEIEDARRGSRSTAEDGGDAEGGGVPDGGGDAGQPDPTATGGVPPSGEVSPVGTDLAAQGTKLAEKPAADPAVASEPFGRAETTLIDKAGNIRLDNLNTPEDVSSVIRQAAADNDDFMTQRRGVLSDAEVLDLSDALGMSPGSLDRRQIGEAFNAEQIVAARKLLIQSATEVRDAMTLAANGTDADVMAYASAKARHQMIQAQVAGITAEAGRALRAFRSLEGMKEAEALGNFLAEATGQTLYQLRSEAVRGSTLDTPLKVTKFIHDATKPGFGEMILEYWINGLISGPATHTTYMVGNALLALWKVGAETPTAATIGAIRQALGGDRARVMFGEVPAQAYGLMRGVRQGIVAGWESAKTGLTTALPEEAVDVMTPTQRARYDTARTAGQTHDQAILDVLGLKGDVPTQYAFGKANAIPDFHIGSIPIPLGTAIRLPGRGVAMIHSFFRAVNYEREMAALAYRTAASEGLEGEAMAQRIGEVTANPSPEMMQEARMSATDLTLMGKGGELTQALSQLTNAKFLGFRWLKFVDPFVHIGSNVIEQAILQRTPAGWLDPKIRSDLMGVNGTIARDTAVARMVAGSTLAVAAGSLAAEGLLTGAGPEDPKEAATKRLTGWQPHSIRIGEMYYDTHRLGPLGMLISVSADLYEVAHAVGKEDSTKVAHMLSHAFSANILDESFMRGPAELIRAIEESDRYGQRYVQQMMASFIPYSVGVSQVARAVDPYSRQAKTTMEAIKAKVPWVSEGLFPRRDVWGQPIPNKDVLGVPGLSAIYESKINYDPVNLALNRLGIFPGQIERRVRGVELTEKQYDDLSRVAGRTAKMQLDQIINSPGFAQIPDAAQRQIIDKTISSAREAGRTLVMMQSVGHENDIIKKAVDAKKAQAGGAAPAKVREMMKLH